MELLDETGDRRDREANPFGSRSSPREPQQLQQLGIYEAPVDADPVAVIVDEPDEC